MNRPQYFWPTPPGYQDYGWVRPVTVNQDPSGFIPPGGYLNDYIIPLDNDLPMLLRSLFIEGVQQAAASGLQIQLRDAFGNYLTDGYIPLWLYATGAGSTPPDGGSGRTKVFEPELYCAPGSNLIADFYNPGGSAAAFVFGAAVVMNPAFDATQIYAYPNNGGGRGSEVFAFNSALYQVLREGAGGNVNVQQSTNGGRTWAALNSALAPTTTSNVPQGGIYFDQVQTLTVATSNGSVIAPAVAPIVLTDFNLVTGLWGLPYAPGSGNVYQVNSLQKRADGSFILVCVDGIAPATLRAYVFSALGVWSNFSLTTSFPAGWTSDGGSQTVFDPLTGIIHMFGVLVNGGNQKFYYQQIRPNNTVGGFQDLSALVIPTAGGIIESSGNPLILAGQLLFGITDVTNSFPTILVGSPLSTPVFSVGATSIMPSFPNPPATTSNICPVLGTDGVNLWAVLPYNPFVGGGFVGQLWVSVTPLITNPTQGWTGGEVYNNGGAGGIARPTISIIQGLPNITFEDPNLNNNFLKASAETASFPPYMEFRGIKRQQAGCAQ
jgi:hypothetical protein